MDLACCFQGTDVSSYERGCVVGLLWFHRAVRIDVLRSEWQCGEGCNFSVAPAVHVENCKLSPHAFGPFCSIVGASITLRTPIACPGFMAKWRLPEDTLSAVLAYIKDPSNVITRAGLGLQAWDEPRPWQITQAAGRSGKPCAARVKARYSATRRRIRRKTGFAARPIEIVDVAAMSKADDESSEHLWFM